MPNISVSDQQELATYVSAKLNALEGTPVAELVYLARIIEIFNGNANLSAVSAEGDTQLTRIQGAGDTEIADVQSEGQTQITAVQNASTTEQNALDGLRAEIEGALLGYQMSPAKVYFLSQS